jgi:hypothetical protein
VGFLIIERAKLIFQQKLALRAFNCVCKGGTADASANVVANLGGTKTNVDDLLS